MFMTQHNAMMFNYFKMNLRAVVAQQDLETMTIKKMYRVATTAQREGKGKTLASINEVWGDEIPTKQEGNENDVAAFNQWGPQPKTGNSNFKNNCCFQPNRGG